MTTNAGNSPTGAGWAPGTVPPSVPPSPRAGGGAQEFGAQPVLTIIREDLTIDGKLSSKGKVVLEGTIQGDLRCAEVVVCEKGQIKGNIVAEEVAIYGRAEGAIYGKSVELFATAEVQGDIFHHGIGMERGTRYEGTLKYLDDPVSAGINKTATPQREGGPRKPGQ